MKNLSKLSLIFTACTMTSSLSWAADTDLSASASVSSNNSSAIQLDSQGVNAQTKNNAQSQTDTQSSLQTSDGADSQTSTQQPPVTEQAADSDADSDTQATESQAGDLDLGNTNDIANNLTVVSDSASGSLTRGAAALNQSATATLSNSVKGLIKTDDTTAQAMPEGPDAEMLADSDSELTATTDTLLSAGNATQMPEQSAPDADIPEDQVNESVDTMLAQSTSLLAGQPSSLDSISNETHSEITQMVSAGVSDTVNSATQTALQQDISGQVGDVVTQEVSSAVQLATATEVSNALADSADLGL